MRIENMATPRQLSQFQTLRLCSFVSLRET